MTNQAVVQDTIVDQKLGHYHVAEKIGAGGMGEVYRARDEHLARDVAIGGESLCWLGEGF